MAPACLNPLLYGWLDPEFRHEFGKIFNLLKRTLGRVCLRNSRSDPTNGNDENGTALNQDRGLMEETTLSQNLLSCNNTFEMKKSIREMSSDRL